MNPSKQIFISSTAPTPTSMVSRERFLWGGLGALAPLLVSLTMLDLSTLERYVNDLPQTEMQLRLAGYSSRVLLLFVIGGIWACLHRMENDPKKLFQLGIVAPAMITAMINTNPVSQDNAEPTARPTAAITFSLIASAHAGENDGKKGRRPTSIEQFVKGFLGR